MRKVVVEAVYVVPVEASFMSWARSVSHCSAVNGKRRADPPGGTYGN